MPLEEGAALPGAALSCPAEAGPAPGAGDAPRVLFLVNRLFEWSQNFVTRELVEIRARGIRMSIGARDVLEREDLSPEERALEECLLRIPENPFWLPSLWRHLKVALSRPRAWLRAWRTLASLGHSPAALPRAVVCLFRAASLVEEVERRRIGLIHGYFLTAPGETALYLSELTGVPFGASAYAVDIYVDDSGLAGKLERASYVNATTRYNERVLRGLVPRDPDKVVTLYYGVRLPPVPETPPPDAPFTFLAAGRLVPKKGFEYLIEACRVLRDEGLGFRCLIVGQGPLRDRLEARTAELGLEERVALAGYVTPNRMADVYRESHVFVAPCVVAEDGDRDGIPNVLLEAMSFGVPVISTTISGIPECVTAGRNGWLVPPADSRRLADAMRAALTTPVLVAMRAAARRVVCDRFDVRKNAGPIAALLEAHARS